MRKSALIIFLILFAAFLLAACGQNANNNNGDQGSGTVVIPTATLTPTPTLPATYTPVPMGHGGHLFAVETRSVHVVQAGETLGGIANMYGVTVRDLARTNRIVNYDLIEVGDVLFVPPCE